MSYKIKHKLELVNLVPYECYEDPEEAILFLKHVPQCIFLAILSSILHLKVLR